MEKMNKQTAVQWFASKVTCLKMNPKEVFDFLQWYEEALEIEKEQIKNAYTEGVWWETETDSEGYYKEVYGSE